MEDIMVFDNIIPPIYSKLLEEGLLKSINDWHFDNTTSDAIPTNSNLVYDQFQFVSKPIDNLNNEFDNSYIHFTSIPISLFALKNKLYFNLKKDLLRCKINLQTQAPNNNKGKFNFPHTDYLPAPDKLITILYYVNDSDGDTYFFKEKFKGSNMSKEEIDNLTIIKKVSPKRGRLVVFKADIMHAGSHPINNPTRVVINYNLLLP